VEPITGDNFELFMDSVSILINPNMVLMLHSGHFEATIEALVGLVGVVPFIPIHAHENACSSNKRQPIHVHENQIAATKLYSRERA